MATGQYLTEVAVCLAERGHEVTVVTSRRAYDHPETKFPKMEIWRGIRIYRVASTGFGKGAKWRRAADFASFLALCALRVALLPRHDVVVALTTPPLISFLGATAAWLRGSRFFYWVMDFNPDEAIAAGWLRPKSLAARLLEWMSRSSLQRATKIIVLDRFMCDRIVAKGIPSAKVAVIPPWSHDTEVKWDPEGRERFRRAHGLDGKFVVMYSGNHSPVHPLDTLLAAARQLASDPGMVFCFIGGGSEWRKLKEGRNQKSVDSRPVPQIVCLPYQPLDQLSASLSAADLHVVVMGNAFLGLVHPCKIYNVLAVGAPVIYIGPEPSHVTEILEGLQPPHLWVSVRHGAAEALAGQIRRLRAEIAGKERQPTASVTSEFSRAMLLPRLVAVLDQPRTVRSNQ